MIANVELTTKVGFSSNRSSYDFEPIEWIDAWIFSLLSLNRSQVTTLAWQPDNFGDPTTRNVGCL